MGCCESKILNTDLILIQDKTAEINHASFDSISIDPDSESVQFLENSNNIHASFSNTFNSFEHAFLTKQVKSRTQIIELHCDDDL